MPAAQLTTKDEKGDDDSIHPHFGSALLTSRLLGRSKTVPALRHDDKKGKTNATTHEDLGNLGVVDRRVVTPLSGWIQAGRPCQVTGSAAVLSYQDFRHHHLRSSVTKIGDVSKY